MLGHIKAIVKEIEELEYKLTKLNLRYNVLEGTAKREYAKEIDKVELQILELNKLLRKTIKEA